MEDVKYIEQLFFKQIKSLTAKTTAQSTKCQTRHHSNFRSTSNIFDYQFSDGWI